MTSTVLRAGNATVDKAEKAPGAHILVVGGQIVRSAHISFCYKEKKKNRAMSFLGSECWGSSGLQRVIRRVFLLEISE